MTRNGRVQYRAAGMGTHQAGAELGRHARKVGIVSTPGVVDQVRAGGAGLLGHLGAPGVDADQLVGERVAQPLDERHHAAISPATSTVTPGPALTPPTSTTSAPSPTTRCAASWAALVGEGGASVVERVRRAVHDRHDQRAIPRHRASQKRRLHVTRLRFRSKGLAFLASFVNPSVTRYVEIARYLGFAVLDLGEVLVIERHVALALAGQHVDRIPRP